MTRDTFDSDDLVRITLNGLCGNIERHLDSDLLFVRCPMIQGLDDHIRKEVESLRGTKIRRSPRLTVVLETVGGSIVVVERIANVFRKHYREITFIVPGYAYSAGTVLVLSGDEIYMDYYSVLGPIDPQIESEDGRLIPGMGYLYMYNQFVEKSRRNELTNAETVFLTKRFDPAIMYLIGQAQNHSEDLIKSWLPRYKFKNWKKTKSRGLSVTPKMKRDRAAMIAQVLGDSGRWHSHGRGITMRDLMSNKIKLQIRDLGADKVLEPIIRQYYDLALDYGIKSGHKYVLHSRHSFRRL